MTIQPGAPTELPKSLSEVVFNFSPTSGPWQYYNLAPKKRDIRPSLIYKMEGSVSSTKSSSAEASLGAIMFSGTDALITLDFGVNTAGIVSIEFGNKCDLNQKLSISFAESKQFIDRISDRSVDFGISDGFLTFEVVPNETYTCPPERMRGGFRYLTLYPQTDGKIEVTSIRTFNNMMPSAGEDLRNYSGYFYSSDAFLNTIWYAGAYTNQLATIPTNTGRRSDWVHRPDCWSNDVPAARPSEIEVLTDGARRDRTVWSGDRSISTYTNFVAFSNHAALKAGVDFMFDQQTEDGLFPYACKPIWIYGSDTYHLWTLICLYNTYFLDGSPDAAYWVRQHWVKAVKGLEYSLRKIDAKGLLKVTLPLDWGRPVLKGHNLAVNCILYLALIRMGELSRDVIGNERNAHEWTAGAEAVKESVNKHLWNEKEGMYTDFIGSSTLPQDGNCLAIWHGVVDSHEKSKQISKGLEQNWNEFGAVAPESTGMISTFIGSMELIAHMEAKESTRSLRLLKTLWGYVWNAPYSVQSSLIEGYYRDGRCYYPFTKYDPAYISHAHPWATGPTVVLTYYLVGIRITNALHDEWLFEPRVEAKDCVDDDSSTKTKFALSGFSSAKGFYSAGWQLSTVSESEVFLELAIKSPTATKGFVKFPLLGKKLVSANMDGYSLDLSNLDTGGMSLQNVQGGCHSFQLRYQH